MQRARPGLLAAILIAASAAHAQPSPETGRWITESGNLEVEVAPCGEYHCGTIVRVIANNAMAGPGAPAAAAAVGSKILFNLRPMEEGGWQGRIYNRATDRTYHSRLQALSDERLKVTIYENDPQQAVVQLWRRPEAP